jgi:hypothetical protein
VIGFAIGGGVASTSAAFLGTPAGSGATVESGRTCPATVVQTRRPPPGSKGLIAASWYGHNGLWVDLEPNGVAAYPNARRLPSGWIETKAVWWRARSAAGRLTIRGKRLYSIRDRMRAQVPEGSGSRGLQPSGLLFPSPGCWKITGKSGGASLSYVVAVRAS